MVYASMSSCHWTSQAEGGKVMTRTNNFRLLIVDDEESILNMFGEIFDTQDKVSRYKSELHDLEEELFSETTTFSSINYTYDLTYCQQGEEAVDEVYNSLREKDPFSVVFLDMRLPPGKNGLWAAEKIRGLDPEIYIVIVTGYSDVDPAELSEKITPASRLLYVKKPVKPQEVRQFADSLTKSWLENRATNRILGRLRSKILKHEIKEFADSITINLFETPGNKLSADLKQMQMRELKESLYKLKTSLHQEVEKLSEANQLLELKEKELEESNVAIKVLMTKQQQDGDLDKQLEELNSQIMFNILELAEPYIEKLESSDLDKDQQDNLTILKKNLRKLTAPAMRNLAGGLPEFTSTEVKIINLIKHGKSTKEIAHFFNLSPRTVDFHRNNIRSKFGLSGSRTSLKSYLRTFQP